MQTYVTRHVHTLYDNSSYVVARYKTVEDTPEMPKGSIIIAKGYDLPTVSNVYIVLQGEWASDPKYNGPSFNVKATEIKTPSHKKGIMSFLMSLRVGIGPKIAEDIFNTFGDKIWDILDNTPDKLLDVKGVTRAKLAKVKNELSKSKVIRDILLAFEDCDKMTAKRARDIFEKYGANSLNIIQENPYTLCEIKGIDFLTADVLAQAMPDFDPKSKERLRAGIQSVLQAKNASGNTCTPKNEVLYALNKALKINDVDCCREALNRAYKAGEIIIKGNFCYNKTSYHTEYQVAANILRLLRTRPRYHITDELMNRFIQKFEEENAITLADQQKEAVRQCFRSNLSIITGGPGTGKSTIIKAVLHVATQINKNLNPLLVAPTGRAARRMQDATGYYASTIHSALGIRYSEDSDAGGEMPTDEPLAADIIIADEVSMIDHFVAKNLFSRVAERTILVLVGDCDQLPSVGAGKVLSEMIDSHMVPVCRLDVIFRQQQGDPIIINSRNILNGDTNLVHTSSFKAFDLNDQDLILETACHFFEWCARSYGLDEVTMLVPYRQKRTLCANNLNLNIRNRLNPLKQGALTMRSHKIEFRPGDKVMQTMNTDDAKNGDVGYILNIEDRPSRNDPKRFERCAIIKFDNGPLEYYDEEMKHIELAYATSVHKSQGQEYPIVIVVMSGEHDLFLRRNLLYTAVTRAKKHVALIGERSAFEYAITTGDAIERCTQLGKFLTIMDKEIPEGEDPRYYKIRSKEKEKGG